MPYVVATRARLRAGSFTSVLCCAMAPSSRSFRPARGVSADWRGVRARLRGALGEAELLSRPPLPAFTPLRCSERRRCLNAASSRSLDGDAPRQSSSSAAAAKRTAQSARVVQWLRCWRAVRLADRAAALQCACQHRGTRAQRRPSAAAFEQRAQRNHAALLGAAKQLRVRCAALLLLTPLRADAAWLRCRIFGVAGCLAQQ